MNDQATNIKWPTRAEFRAEWRETLDRAGFEVRVANILYKNFSSKDDITEHVFKKGPLSLIAGIGVQSEERIMKWLGME